MARRSQFLTNLRLKCRGGRNYDDKRSNPVGSSPESPFMQHIDDEDMFDKVMNNGAGCRSKASKRKQHFEDRSHSVGRNTNAPITSQDLDGSQLRPTLQEEPLFRTPSPTVLKTIQSRDETEAKSGSPLYLHFPGSKSFSSQIKSSEVVVKHNLTTARRQLKYSASGKYTFQKEDQASNQKPEGPEADISIARQLTSVIHNVPDENHEDVATGSSHSLSLKSDEKFCDKPALSEDLDFEDEEHRRRAMDLYNSIDSEPDNIEETAEDKEMSRKDDSAPINGQTIDPVPPDSQSQRRKERLTDSRKRTRNPSLWKRNLAKIGLNSGIEHLNQTGKLIPAKKMGDGCNASLCRYKCHTKLSEEDRKLFFVKFWGLQDHLRQWDFINRYVKLSVPQQRKFLLETNAKQHTRRYHMVSEGKDVRVCQIMFLSTLNISDKMVRTAHDKVDRSNGVTISPDKRGPKPKVLSESQLLKISRIDEHIKKFRAIPSHFCRKETKRKYLEPGLSISKMYSMYVKWMEKYHPGEKKVSECKYRIHFCNQYNFGFFYPRKDQCELCNVYVRGNTTFKEKIKTKYKTHEKEKDLARALKKQDKKDAMKNPNQICFATFDFQKQLNTPKDETSVLYYKRKMITYNFTVVDGGKKATCYVWNESEGKKGANEVASCLSTFIAKIKEERGVSEFRLWSDNCYGQNKNKYVFSMCDRLCHKLNVTIKVRFLETGHTQNECDTVHGRIEDASKRIPVFTSEQWYDIMKTASKEPYDIVKMKGKFFDFHRPAEVLQKWDGKGVAWKSVREVIFDPTTPQGTVSVRYSLTNEAPIKTINVARNLPGRPTIFASVPLKTLYVEEIQLKPDKLKDIAYLCQEFVIPAQHQAPFRALRGFPVLPALELDAEPNDINDSDNEDIVAPWQLEGMNEPDPDYEKMSADENANIVPGTDSAV